MTENGAKCRYNTVWQRVLEVAGVLSLVVGAFALVIAWQARQDTLWIARQSGALDKPRVQLQLGSHKIEQSLLTKVYLGAPLEEGKAVNFASLPFAIANSGEKTAEDIDVVDQYPKIGRPFLHEDLGYYDFKTEGFSPPDEKIHHETKEVGPFSYIYYNIPSINPYSGVEFNQPYLLRETNATLQEPKYDVSVDIRFGLRQQISLSARDHVPHDYSLAIEVLQAQSDEELLDKAVQSVSKDLSRQREDLPFPASLITPLETTALVAFAQPELLNEEGDIKGYNHEFRPEKIRSITTVDRSVAAMYGPVLLVVATVLLLLAAFLRFRRR